MFRRRRLRCSFCRRDEAHVAKLVAGPRVYICDECVAAASRIIAESGDGSTRHPRPGIVARVSRRIWRAIETRSRYAMPAVRFP